MTTHNLIAVHPGEILREEYLKPMNMSAPALARYLNVPRTRIERIASEKTVISPDTALRLAKFFKTTPAFWMNLQRNYDLYTAAQTVDVSGIPNIDALSA